MNHNRLFEQALHELQTLVASDAEYDIVSSSRLLRQLLLDGDALVNIVNRELRSSPAFKVRVPSDSNVEANWIDPVLSPGLDDEYLELDLRRFLSHQVGISDGRPVTVRQVIKYAAIVLGGVHFKAEPGDDLESVARHHVNKADRGLSPVLQALRHVGAVARDALAPVRDLMLSRERFEGGRGWTAMISLNILPVPPDEENYIFDIGLDEHRNRLSIYVDTRGELTFRLVDRTGARKYLRAGPDPNPQVMHRPIVIACEFSSLEAETLLSLRTNWWDHAEIVQGIDSQEIGDPFYFVIGSDCRGKKATHMFVYEHIVVGRPLTSSEFSNTVDYMSSKAAKQETGLHYKGHQFHYSVGHPNFPEIAT